MGAGFYINLHSAFFQPGQLHVETHDFFYNVAVSRLTQIQGIHERM